MTNARLVTPGPEYLGSYLAACRLHKENGVQFHSFHDPDEYEQWRTTIFDRYEKDRLGIDLEPGLVPQTTLWLVEDGRYIGTVNIRHRLTEALEKTGGHIGYIIRCDKWGQGYGTLQLSLALEEAAKLGLARVLLTCREENIASARVMEKCGGVLQDIIDVEDKGEVRRTKRCWINTAPYLPNRYLHTARLYDLDPRGIMQDDIPFYLEYAAKQQGEVLELACGTGRVSLPLAEAGHTVTGLDISEPMLGRLREKLAALPREVRDRVTVVPGDMSEFSLGRRFSLIIVPFRAFQSLTDLRDAESCLACARGHLAPGGLFILDVFHPKGRMDQGWCYPEALQWEQGDPATGNRIMKTHRGDRIDVENQIIYPRLFYTVTAPDGGSERFEESLALRYYYHDQILGLLESAGFEVKEEYGWYDKSPIVSDREQIFVCSAKRENGQ